MTGPHVGQSVLYDGAPLDDVYALSLHDALPILNAQDTEDQVLKYIKQGKFTFRIVMGGEGEKYTLGKAYGVQDRKSTRLNSSHVAIAYAVSCLKNNNRQGRRYRDVRQSSQTQGD